MKLKINIYNEIMLKVSKACNATEQRDYTVLYSSIYFFFFFIVSNPVFVSLHLICSANLISVYFLRIGNYGIYVLYIFHFQKDFIRKFHFCAIHRVSHKSNEEENLLEYHFKCTYELQEFMFSSDKIHTYTTTT